MRNPARRNRNIGTAKQGHGHNNKMSIPKPCNCLKEFHEQLGNYAKVEKVINGHTFTFIIEENRKGVVHACSVDDVARMIECIPSEDYGEIKWIIFRQPKRKEEILNPAWGRLIYSYEFENEYHPAIIIEAFDRSKKMKWFCKLSVDDQKELERLKSDGHLFKREGRFFVSEANLENVRATQLYRTLPHEFGHYVHYLEIVERPSVTDEPYEKHEGRTDFYFKIPSDEKEKFAHRYAHTLKARLTAEQKIQFDLL